MKKVNIKNNKRTCDKGKDIDVVSLSFDLELECDIYVRILPRFRLFRTFPQVYRLFVYLPLRLETLSKEQ